MCDPRQDRQIRTEALLEKLKIPYTKVDHAPAMTMEDCEAVDAELGVRMCKNLFLCNRQKTQFYLLMMPGEKKFHTKLLTQQLGVSRLSFADEGDMVRLLDIHPGAVSVMGLMNDTGKEVQLLIDRDLMEEEFLGCHPCVNTASLRLPMKDLLEVFLPAVGHAPRIVDLPEE